MAQGCLQMCLQTLGTIPHGQIHYILQWISAFFKTPGSMAFGTFKKRCYRLDFGGKNKYIMLDPKPLKL